MEVKFKIEPIDNERCRIVDIDPASCIGQTIKELTVPAEVEHDGKKYKVAEVGRGALFVNKFDADKARFSVLSKISIVTFAEGIECVDGVFYTEDTNNADQRGNLETLKEVHLPSTIKRIGDNTFAYAKRAVINIPDGVEEIGAYAFFRCESMSVYAFPPHIRKIGDGAFGGVPDNRSEEEQKAYTLVIPDTVAEIGAYVFRNGSRHYKTISTSAKVFNILGNAVSNILIDELNVPEGTTMIADKAFTGNGIQRLTLPSTLRRIGNNAFNHYTHGLLTELTLPEGLEEIGDCAFENAFAPDQNVVVTIPSTVIKCGEMPFYTNCQEHMIMPLFADEATRERISANPGFFNGTLVENITVPQGVEVVEIEGCPKLKSLMLPEGVSSVKLNSCPNLPCLTLPEGVTSVILRYCTNLANLTLPSSVTKLGISENKAMEAIELPEGIECRNEMFFYSKMSIKASLEVWKRLCATERALNSYKGTELIIPEGCETIAEDFCKWASIEKVSLPSSLKEIGGSAFRGTHLEHIVIPEGVTAIGSCAFEGSHLKEITLPSTLEMLGSECFKNSHVSHITFPAGIREYGSNFVRYTDIESFTFLSTDPATAVYPEEPGKKVKWYVPDGMVEHVKSLPTAKAAKGVYPISKLESAAKSATESKEKTASDKTKAKAPAELTDAAQIVVENNANVHIAFPVTDAEMKLLETFQTAQALFLYFLNNRADEARVWLADGDVYQCWSAHKPDAKSKCINLTFADDAEKVSIEKDRPDSGQYIVLSTKLYGKIHFDFMLPKRRKANPKKVKLVGDSNIDTVWDRMRGTICKGWICSIILDDDRRIEASEVKGSFSTIHMHKMEDGELTEISSETADGEVAYRLSMPEANILNLLNSKILSITRLNK